MISDAWARRIAADWHDGQGSALHMLASGGATHDGRWGWDDLLAAVERAGDQQVGADMLTGRDRRELGDLAAYITAAGPRGPVDGWAALPWPQAEDPWVGAYTAAGAVLGADGWALTVEDHPARDWLDHTDTWAGTLTHHGQPAATVRGPAGGPAAWPGVEHRLWGEVRPELARGFVTTAGRAGIDLRTALTGLAHVAAMRPDPRGASEVTATFLYEGFRDWVDRNDPHQQRVLRAGGAIEQAHLMARYAPVVDLAAALALAEDPDGRDRPGVLEYEVINPVGWWLAERTAETGQLDATGLPAAAAQAATATRGMTQAFLADGPGPRTTQPTAPAAITATTAAASTPQRGQHR